MMLIQNWQLFYYYNTDFQFALFVHDFMHLHACSSCRHSAGTAAADRDGADEASTQDDVFFKTTDAADDATHFFKKGVRREMKVIKREQYLFSLSLSSRSHGD